MKDVNNLWKRKKFGLQLLGISIFQEVEFQVEERLFMKKSHNVTFLRNNIRTKTF